MFYKIFDQGVDVNTVFITRRANARYASDMLFLFSIVVILEILGTFKRYIAWLKLIAFCVDVKNALVFINVTILIHSDQWKKVNRKRFSFQSEIFGINFVLSGSDCPLLADKGLPWNDFSDKLAGVKYCYDLT